MPSTKILTINYYDALKVLKFNNHIVGKINNHNISSFNNNAVMSGVSSGGSSGITDLTGTMWTINSITCEAGYGQFNTQILLNGEPHGDDGNLYIGYTWDRVLEVTETANRVLIYSFLNELSVGDTIAFVGGTDVTNPNLIAWIQANASPYTPPSSGGSND